MKLAKSTQLALIEFNKYITGKMGADIITPLIDVLIAENPNYRAACQAVQQMKNLSAIEGPCQIIAKTLFGFCLQNGLTVKKDYKGAVALYKQAVDQQCAIAERLLAFCLSYCFFDDVEQDKKLAEELSKRSAEHGFEFNYSRLRSDNDWRDDWTIEPLMDMQNGFKERYPDLEKNLFDQTFRLSLFADAILKGDADLFVFLTENSREAFDIFKMDIVEIFIDPIKRHDAKQFVLLLNHVDNTFFKVLKTLALKKSKDSSEDYLNLLSDRNIKKFIINCLLETRGESVLSLAAQENFSQAVQLLLAAGADPGPNNLDSAIKARNLEIALLLLRPMIRSIVEGEKAQAEKEQTEKAQAEKVQAEKEQAAKEKQGDDEDDEEDSEQEKRKREERREKYKGNVLVSALQALLPEKEQKTNRERKERLDSGESVVLVRTSDSAIRSEILSLIFELLSVMKSPNAGREYFSKTPLHLAVLSGCARLVEYFINAKKHEKAENEDKDKDKGKLGYYRRYDDMMAAVVHSEDPNSADILELLMNHKSKGEIIDDFSNLIRWSSTALYQRNIKKFRVLCGAISICLQNSDTPLNDLAIGFHGYNDLNYLGTDDADFFKAGIEILLETPLEPPVRTLHSFISLDDFLIAKRLFDKFSPQAQFQFFCKSSGKERQFALENMKDESFKVKTLKDADFPKGALSQGLESGHPQILRFLGDIHPDEPHLELSYDWYRRTALDYTHHYYRDGNKDGHRACLLELLKRGANPFQKVKSHYRKNYSDNDFQSFFEEAACMGFVEGIKCITEMHCKNSADFAKYAKLALKEAFKHKQFLIITELSKALSVENDKKLFASFNKEMENDFNFKASAKAKQLLIDVKKKNYGSVLAAAEICLLGESVPTDAVKPSEILFLFHTMINQGVEYDNFPEIDLIRKIFTGCDNSDHSNSDKKQAADFAGDPIADVSIADVSIADVSILKAPLLANVEISRENDGRLNLIKRLILQYFSYAHDERQTKDEKELKEAAEIGTKRFADNNPSAAGISAGPGPNVGAIASINGPGSIGAIASISVGPGPSIGTTTGISADAGPGPNAGAAADFLGSRLSIAENDFQVVLRQTLQMAGTGLSQSKSSGVQQISAFEAAATGAAAAVAIGAGARLGAGVGPGPGISCKT